MPVCDAGDCWFILRYARDAVCRDGSDSDHYSAMSRDVRFLVVADDQ